MQHGKAPQESPLDGLIDLIVQRVVEALPKPEVSKIPEGFMSVKSAAVFLDTTEMALRQCVKRKQIVPHRSRVGKPLFTIEMLEEFATAGGR